MRSDKLQFFKQAIADLHDTGLGFSGTCPNCGKPSLTLKILSKDEFEPSCPDCKPGEIRDAVRAFVIAARVPKNGATIEPTVDLTSARPWTSAKALMAKEIPALKWIVPGIIPEGLTILAGRPKQGKSWGIYGVGVAVAVGGKAFGVRQVEQGDVLYLALEDGERRLKERMGIILRGQPIPEKFDWAIKWPRLAGPGHMPTPENPDCRSQILWWLDEHPEARMVAVDTLVRVKPRTQKHGNAYEQDSAALEPLAAVAAERRIALVLVTHTRKPIRGGSVTDVFDEIMDSTGITGGADTMLVLKKTRREQELSLWMTGRDVEDQELLIQWDLDTSDWRLLGPAQEARTSVLRQAILACLGKTEETLSTAEVASRIGKESREEVATVKTTLYRLADQDLVISVSPGKFRRKPRAFE